MLNGIAAEGLVKIEAVAPADDDANAIYQYLIGSDGSASDASEQQPAFERVSCSSHGVCGGYRRGA
jgi:hypothetical protein